MQRLLKLSAAAIVIASIVIPKEPYNNYGNDNYPQVVTAEPIAIITAVVVARIAAIIHTLYHLSKILAATAAVITAIVHKKE